MGESILVEELVSSWCDQLKFLSKIAKTEPQAAHVAFLGGFKHKLRYYIRTMRQLPRSY